MRNHTSLFTPSAVATLLFTLMGCSSNLTSESPATAEPAASAVANNNDAGDPSQTRNSTPSKVTIEGKLILDAITCADRIAGERVLLDLVDNDGRIHRGVLSLELRPSVHGVGQCWRSESDLYLYYYDATLRPSFSGAITFVSATQVRVIRGWATTSEGTRTRLTKSASSRSDTSYSASSQTGFAEVIFSGLGTSRTELGDNYVSDLYVKLTQ